MHIQEKTKIIGSISGDRDKTVQILAQGRMRKEQCIELYRIALEAFLSVYSVVTVSKFIGHYSLRKAQVDASGRLTVVSYLPLSEWKGKHRKNLSRIVLSGGAVIESDTPYPLSASQSFATILSDSFSCHFTFSHPVYYALDIGHYAAVTRSSLFNPACKELFSEGAPAISSFSEFIEHPSLVSYECANGRYSIFDRRFDIMER